MRFTKMHGLGNDYVFVNGFKETVLDPASVAVKIADRHTGIGSDGLILVQPADPGTGADARMRMFNADGSEAEMCGNGIRCVCKLVHDHGISRSSPMRIQTGRGVLSLTYCLDPRGKVDRVTVDMGEPVLEPGLIPVDLPDMTSVVNHSIGGLIDWPLDLPPGWIDDCGLDPGMTCVSMGNPHVVLFCRDVGRVPLEAAGRALETHRLFPDRINVHFVQVHAPTVVTMRTWERGSGATRACGTGASAACVAGCLTGRTERSVLAHLPGGDLALHWRASDNHVLMTGPATEVYSGEWLDPGEAT